MHAITVPATRPYQVTIGRGLLSRAGECIGQLFPRRSVAVVSDDTVFALYGQTVMHSLEASGCTPCSFVFEHGEASKNLTTYSRLMEFLARSRLTRADVVAALGGGVTGDLAGFAAATYLRGIAAVQLPTTLLAAVDSSVGGKTAVNLPQGKNLAGAFHLPAAVFCDCAAFDSLPEHIVRDGCAEVLKYGMICDAELLRLAKTPDVCKSEAVIERCMRIKSRITAADEHDTGQRQLLNFGHTIGHAIEACSGFSCSHGQAVAAGMAYITRAAARMGLCREECAAELESTLRAFGLPVSTSIPARALFEAALSDKKCTGQDITLVLPQAVGQCVLKTMPSGCLLDFIKKGEQPL